MSVSSSYSYTVDLEAERRAREQARREREQEQLRDRAAAVGRAVAEAQARYGEQISVAAVAAPSSATQDALDGARAAIAAAEQALRDQVTAARQRALLQALTAAGAVRDSGVATRRAAERAAAPESSDRVSAEDVIRVYEILADDVPAAEAEQLHGQAEQVRSDGDPAGERLRLEALRASVQQANARASDRARRAHEIAEWRGRLAGLPQDADAVRRATALLDEAGEGEGPLPPAAVDQLDGLLRAAELELRRRIAAEALEQSLLDLGYDVGPSFDTVLADRGTADFRSGRWPGYAVRVRFTPGAEQLSFVVVRGDHEDAEARRDAEVEREWCDRRPAVAEAMGKHGLTAQELGVVPVGAMPVQVVGDVAVPTADREISRPRTRERRR